MRGEKYNTILNDLGFTNAKIELYIRLSHLGKMCIRDRVMTYGYNPLISKWSPYHGAMYAIVESVAKIVAMGGNYHTIRFSFQEYFEKLLDNPITWGKPTAALLGA